MRMRDRLQTSGQTRGQEHRDLHLRSAPVLGRSNCRSLGCDEPAQPTGHCILLRPRTGALRFTYNPLCAFVVRPGVSLAWGSEDGMSGVALRRFRIGALFALFVSLCGIFFQIATLAAEEEAELLRPPRGELRPAFWSQYGWWVALAAVVGAGAVVVWMKWVRRPKLVVVTPPEALACSAFESLRGRTEDGALVAEVSRVFRRYVGFAFNLPPDELTTGELHQALKSDARAGPDLIAAILEFLRRCDEWKFARVPTTAPTGVVQRALDLLEKSEAHRAQAKPPALPKR